MKHQLLIAVALLFALTLLLTACGRNENTASDPASSDAAPTSSVTDAPATDKTYVDDGTAELDDADATQAPGTNSTTVAAVRGTTATEDNVIPMTAARKTRTAAPTGSDTPTTTKKALPNDPDFGDKENWIIVPMKN